MRRFYLICTILISNIAFQVNCSYAQADVLTQHNDLARTGLNNQETILNTSNVNPNSFGLLYFRNVDDQIFAQPLIVSGVNIPSAGIKNIVYLCTANNTIYAFDADDSTKPAYWQVNYTPSGYRPPVANDMHPGLCGGYYHDFLSNIGIIGTPVIDKAANTIYFVTKIVSTAPGVEDNHSFDGNERSYTTAGFYQYLHAVDLSTGLEKPGSPISITATYNGPGDGNVNGIITFDPRRQFNRAGLVLSKGMIYIAFAAHCDWDPYHGWVLGYSAASLQQKVVYMTTPNDGRGGIWMSGAAPAVDSLGNIYFASGNGYDDGTTYTDSPTDTANRGESVVRLTPNAPDTTVTVLKVTSYFTPRYYLQYNDGDLDYPMQTLLIPNTSMLLTGCKDNDLYLMDKNNLGGFDSNVNHILQEISLGQNVQNHSSFAYFAGPSNQYVYQFAENTLLKSYTVGSGSLTNPVSSSISGPTGISGAYMSVSSNGSDPASAILWISHAVNGCNANQQLCPGIFRAVRADDVTTELWNSNMSPTDNIGNFAKMTCPSIANGKVYVNTFSNKMAVYGLKINSSCNSYPNVASAINNVNASYSASSTAAGSSASNAFDGATSSSWTAETTGAGGGDTANITVNLGAKYDICKVIIYWGSVYAKSFNIEGSNDGINYTIISSDTNNSSVNSVITFATASYQYIKMAGVVRSSTANGYVINEMEVYGQLSNPCSAPTGLAATNLGQNTATLSWQTVTGATSYIVQYKTSIVSSWVQRTISSNSINISALTCGTGYTFEVQAMCATGLSATATGTFTTSACTASCGLLPTRYFSADIGDIGVAGSTCLSNGIYTLNGSGTDIGGNEDQFQYAFTNLSGNEHVVAQVLTQDASNPYNKVGLMFRDSVSNTSPYAFVAVTSGNGVVFQYRSSPGGPTTTITVSGIAAPYWLELNKSGTQYSAYISPSGAANSWVQIGTSVDLGFGGLTSYVGMAITSDDNSVLSTATIANYEEVPTVLPLGLVNFTGTNVNNQYVLLKWTDSQEDGIKNYAVQRSLNSTDFNDIAKVNAINSNTAQAYSAYDYHPYDGINYYRLKEIDNNNLVSYSNIISVNFGVKGIPHIYPNPVKSDVTVVEGLEAINEISVFDVSGKTIIHVANSNNLSSIIIPMANLSAGVYIVKITTASNVYQQKVFKQ